MLRSVPWERGRIAGKERFLTWPDWSFRRAVDVAGTSWRSWLRGDRCVQRPCTCVPRSRPPPRTSQISAAVFSTARRDEVQRPRKSDSRHASGTFGASSCAQGVTGGKPQFGWGAILKANDRSSSTCCRLFLRTITDTKDAGLLTRFLGDSACAAQATRRWPRPYAKWPILARMSCHCCSGRKAKDESRKGAACGHILVDAIEKMGKPAVPNAIEALSDENREVRARAVSALGRIGDTRAVISVDRTNFFVIIRKTIGLIYSS